MSGEYNGLYATPSRLALLEQIADGDVYRDTHGERFHASPGRTVTAMVQAMIRARWVEQRSEPGDTWRKQVHLTDTGKAVLEAHGV